ncbi:MAG: hypothetical protein RBR30_02770 [Tenuifilaceae bacterium]|nr:hypothetical protein [Tenuifilaceae bacterium]
MKTEKKENPSEDLSEDYVKLKQEVKILRFFVILVVLIQLYNLIARFLG